MSTLQNVPGRTRLLLAISDEISELSALQLRCVKTGGKLTPREQARLEVLNEIIHNWSPRTHGDASDQPSLDDHRYTHKR